jgi:hypothetical protein
LCGGAGDAGRYTASLLRGIARLNQRDIDNLWFSFKPIPGVAFGLNDAVRIKSGEHAGESASVISLVSLEPMPTYIVELGSGGGDIEVAEVNLESAV